ncbi:hypothetical protein MMC16_002558 [Acarospora aff. strigata]|nr:hypothetical protein [Acarospora aff. strigata]
MHYLKTILVGAVMATVAVAQSTLAFTSTPSTVTAGNPVTITYASADSSPVTITLRKGDPNNLSTISVLTTSATGGSYTWTPDASLADGKDYALQITQGLTSINYSGQFSVTGGSASAQSSASATSSMSMSSAYVSSVAMSSASVSSVVASLNQTVSSIVASLNSSMPTTTIGGTAASAGTGTAMMRNTTMSIATLTSTASSTETSSDSSMTGSATSGTRSGTAGGSSSTSTPGSSNSAAGLASPLALVLSAIVAVIYLN